MAITITAPAVGARVGPGLVVRLHTDVIGPIAISDGWQVTILDQATGNALLYGEVKANGSHDQSVVPGVVTYPNSGLGESGSEGGLADGALVQLVARRLNNGFFPVIETVTVSGYHWDAVSGLPYLLGNIGRATTDLSAVLAAVQRIFPAA